MEKDKSMIAGRRHYDVERRIAIARALNVGNPDEGGKLYESIIRDLAAKASTDVLTGLPNRRELTDKLNAIQNDADFNGLPYGLVFADIDDFKRFNGTYGHTKADEALQEAGRFFSGSLREEDVAFRYAGDEFVIVASRADLTGISTVVEKVVRGFNRAGIGREAFGGDVMTISAGAAAWYQGTTAQKVLERADYGLRKAKAVPGKGRFYIVQENEEIS